MTDCLYRRLAADGDEAVFESTDGTRSNWDPRIQHGSPPLALLTKTIEELAAGTGLRIARLTLDITPALRARIKVSAFARGVTVADLLRGLLEREFPENHRENTP